MIQCCFQALENVKLQRYLMIVSHRSATKGEKFHQNKLLNDFHAEMKRITTEKKSSSIRNQQMSLLEDLLWCCLSRAMAADSNISSIGCRYSRIRVVCSRFDICVEYYTVFRRHLLGFKFDTKTVALLDEFRIQHGVCRRNGSKMDGIRFHKIFHQLLDHSRFHHCLCK